MADATPIPMPMPMPMPMPPLPDRPLVSVLITNYNYAAFLPVALDALLGQTYPHFEAVVCDDGSTDDSAAVVQAYADRDARVRLVRQANGGQTAAVNECFRHLRGHVVCLLDADDVFAANKLHRIVAALAGDATVGVVTHAIPRGRRRRAHGRRAVQRHPRRRLARPRRRRPRGVRGRPGHVRPLLPTRSPGRADADPPRAAPRPATATSAWPPSSSPPSP